MAEHFADAAGGRGMLQSFGFASQSCAADPGEHSLKLGTPGLNYAAPVGAEEQDWQKLGGGMIPRGVAAFEPLKRKGGSLLIPL